MPQDTLVEDRLATLEREVAQLKLRLRRPGVNWLERLAGSMADQPDCDQVLEFGQSARRAG